MDENQQPQKNKRWYDREPVVKQSIELLSTFPANVLTVMAEGVNTVIEREYKVQDLLRSFKSLGQEKVLALYKSKKKMRNLDQNPAMHQTVNYLFVIAEENKQAIAQQVLELVSIMYDYLQICKKSGFTPTIHHIIEIRDTYVIHGTYYARGVLDLVRQEIAQILISQRQAPGRTPSPATVRGTEADRSIHVSGDDEGMRINFNAE